jgi:hypothetical protein
MFLGEGVNPYPQKPRALSVNCQLSTINEEGGHGGTAPTNCQLSTAIISDAFE